MFHLVSYWLVLGEPKVYQNLVCFTKMWGIYLEVLGEGVILVIVKFHF